MYFSKASSKPVSSLRWLLYSFVAIACLSYTYIPLYGVESIVELTSPKDNDHFEVTRPLLFWGSLPAAQKYDIYIDGTNVGEVPAAPIPVMHYSVTKPLPVGIHHWSIKAIPASGDAVASVTSGFTVDPPGNWPAWAIGPFQRYGNGPILGPRGTGWESAEAYNPGAIFDHGKFRMLYRAQAKSHVSRVGYAESVDGVTFVRNPQPLIDATEPFEEKYGCEDIRIIKSGGVYYAFYTGGDAKGHIALCEATSTDAVTWKKLGIIKNDTKNGCVICNPHDAPVKINGKYAMFLGNSNFGVCYSDDLINWGPITWFDMHFPAGWDKPYEPCVAVTDYSTAEPDNIVLFIAGKLNGQPLNERHKWRYAISEVLFSKSDLTRKVDQLDDCILKPGEFYDNGATPKSLWMHCIIQHDNQWMIYHGSGNRYVGLATAPVK